MYALVQQTKLDHEFFGKLASAFQELAQDVPALKRDHKQDLQDVNNAALGLRRELV